MNAAIPRHNVLNEWEGNMKKPLAEFIGTFTLVLFAMTYDYDGKGKISRFEGLSLATAYTAYIAYVVLQNV